MSLDSGSPALVVPQEFSAAAKKSDPEPAFTLTQSLILNLPPTAVPQEFLQPLESQIHNLQNDRDALLEQQQQLLSTVKALLAQQEAEEQQQHAAADGEVWGSEEGLPAGEEGLPAREEALSTTTQVRLRSILM